MAQRTTPRSHDDAPDAAGHAADAAPVTGAAGRDPDHQTGHHTGQHLAARLAAVAGGAREADDGALARLRERAARRTGRFGRRDGASNAERDARRRDEALRAAEEGNTDWAHVGIFGAGLIVGAFLGAGAALLLAPTTGFETRARLARNARRTGGRVADRWDELSDTLRREVRRGRRRAGRVVTSSRWAAEDAWERRRPR